METGTYVMVNSRLTCFYRHRGVVEDSWEGDPPGTARVALVGFPAAFFFSLGKLVELDDEGKASGEK